MIGILLVQMGAAAFLLTRTGGDEVTPEERVTAEEALAEGSQAQTEGRLDVAEDAYMDVLAADPKNKVALYNLGVLEESKGPGNRAEAYYTDALAVDANFVPALFNLAVLRSAQGKHQEAADLYRKVIDLRPSMAEAHLNLGFVLLRNLGNEREGKSELLKAIVLDESLAARVPPEDLR